MKESLDVVKIAVFNYIQEHKLNENFDKEAYHLHVPMGATPKDGPSAGAAITAAMYSLLNGKKIKNDIAITGEINLRGRVTAIGGIKEKIKGAIKSGIKTILYPKENKKDFHLVVHLYR